LSEVSVRGVGQELETGFIVVLLVILTSVVFTVDFGEICLNLGINISERLSLFPHLIQNLKTVVMLT
jgi:hypothetical protein